MKIVMIVEGATEKAFLPYLREYLKKILAGKMPKLDIHPYDGRIPTGAKLKRVVENYLVHQKNPADHVIALTDVYTGSNPPEFKDAADAKAKMWGWVGPEERFHPHAAQYDFDGNDLSVAISQCSELKALVNTILSICGVACLP